MPTPKRRMHIWVTPGDPDGIGPEVTLKALASKEISRLSRQKRIDWTIVGGVPKWLTGRLAHKLCPNQGFRWLIPPEGSPGFMAGWSIAHASKAVLAGEGQALVTGPIDKARLQAGGFAYPGHTEFLQAIAAAQLKNKAIRNKKAASVFSKDQNVTMMLSNSKMRVSLVTTHLAVHQISAAITPQNIDRTIRHTVDYLRKRLSISYPKVAVCALNPHAGDNGIFGREEITVLNPTIQRAQNRLGKTAKLFGPISADTLFARELEMRRYDAIVCMYHDQGLIPIKLLDFGGTVNITLNLPFIRTSVDHGVAFDIAGRNIADPGSMIAAMRQAADLVVAK